MLGRTPLLFALLLMASPAEAGLSVCNHTQASVRFALAHFDGKVWFSEGWWNLPAGNCRIVIAEPLKARYYYLYALDGGPGSWDGVRGFCVDPAKDFRLEGRGDCAGGGFERREFFEVDTGEAVNYTQYLSD